MVHPGEYILNVILNLYVLMFGAIHFMYYINKSIATKVDSTYLGY